jgi:hypothetical protein
MEYAKAFTKSDITSSTIHPTRSRFGRPSAHSLHILEYAVFYEICGSHCREHIDVGLVDSNAV